MVGLRHPKPIIQTAFSTITFTTHLVVPTPHTLTTFKVRPTIGGVTR